MYSAILFCVSSISCVLSVFVSFFCMRPNSFFTCGMSSACNGVSCRIISGLYSLGLSGGVILSF